MTFEGFDFDFEVGPSLAFLMSCSTSVDDEDDEDCPDDTVKGFDYGIIAGGGYGQNVATCAAMPDRMLWVFAQQAIAEMGERARVMPLITIGGVGALDPLGEDPSGTLYSDPRWTIGGCTGNAFLEGMAINNLLTGGDPTGQFLTIVSDGRFNHDTVSNERGHVPGGFGWTKEIWRDPAGCRVGERWRIEQMGHTYPGGTAEPKAPSAASMESSPGRLFVRHALKGGGRLVSLNPTFNQIERMAETLRRSGLTQ